MKRKVCAVSRSATLGDIAATAGVSIGTVSKALNDTVGVSPANRERIMRAVEEMGYRRSETRGRSPAPPRRRPSSPMTVTSPTTVFTARFFGA